MFIVGNISAQCGKNNVVKVCLDTIVRQTKYINETTELKRQNQTLQQNLQTETENSKIDKFLNLTDTAIFGSRFLKVEIKQLHPQRRDWYFLIENIHDLNVLLPNPSNITIGQIEILKRDDILKKAEQKISKINSFDCFDFLSEQQKQYFRQLVAQYNTLNKYANP
jgi:hypothetical protein